MRKKRIGADWECVLRFCISLLTFASNGGVFLTLYMLHYLYF